MVNSHKFENLNLQSDETQNNNGDKDGKTKKNDRLKSSNIGNSAREKFISAEQVTDFKNLRRPMISTKISKRINRAFENFKVKMIQLYGENYETNRNLASRFKIEDPSKFKVEISNQESENLLLQMHHTSSKKHKKKKTKKSQPRKSKASPPPKIQTKALKALVKVNEETRKEDPKVRHEESKDTLRVDSKDTKRGDSKGGKRPDSKSTRRAETIKQVETSRDAEGKPSSKLNSAANSVNDLVNFSDKLTF